MRANQIIQATMVAGFCAAAALAEPAPSRKLKSDATERILRKEVIVSATLDDVWKCWTTEEGIATFFSPESKIELKLGGAFDIYFKGPADETGKRGAEGAKILSYIPNEFLAFDWGFPPKVPGLRRTGAKTQVMIRFEDVGDGKVKVKFAQLGWKKGREWDEGFAYFDQAWSYVLNNLKEHFEKTPSKRATEEPETGLKTRTWMDKHVKVTAVDVPLKRQDFEMEIPVSINRVWSILATTDGFKRLGAKEPLVELKPGGSYCFWPGAPTRVLAFVPQEILSVTGSAPPEYPNVRAGGLWGAYYFTKLDPAKTKLRLSVIGWRPGDKEWDAAYDYFLKNNPIFLNNVYNALVKDNASASTGDVLKHEAVVDAPVADVWEAFTTRKGVESWMVAHGEVDLRIGGKMRTHYDPKGVLGDENTIENTILSFEPMRMLSIKATKCPANFPFKAAIDNMWTVLYLESLGPEKTRVTCVGMGYGDDEESQKLRQHFDRGNAYTLKKLQEHFATTTANEPSPAAEKKTTEKPAESNATNSEPGHASEFESYLAHIAAASASLALNETDEARRWLDRAPESHRNWEWKYFSANLDQSVRSWSDQGEVVMSVAYSPDGRLMGQALANGEAILRDAESGDVLRTLKENDKALWHLAFSADGKKLATSSSDGAARVWDAESGRLLLTLKHEKTQVYSSSFSPDGKYIATSMLSYVKLWDAQTGEELRTFKGHVEKPPVTRVTFSPDGKWLASASWDNHVIVWDVEKGKQVHKLGPGYGGEEYSPFNAVVFSPDGMRLAASTGTNAIWLWNADSGDLIRKWAAHDKTAYGLAFSPDGKRLASTSVDQSVRIWDANKGELIEKLNGHSGTVWSVAFSPDGARLATGGEDQCVKLWQVGDAATPLVLRCEKGVWAAPFSPDGKRLATASSDRSVKIWDSQSGKLLAAFADLPEQAACVAFSPDSSRVAAGTNDPVVHVWDVTNQRLLHQLKGHKGGVPSLEFTPDAKRLVTSSYDRSIKIWDADAGTELKSIDRKDGYAYSIAIRPDGKSFASADYDGKVRLWDLESGEERRALEGHTSRLMKVVFSADGRLVASAGYDRSIRVWDVQTGKAFPPMTGHDREITGLAFSPDRTRLASASSDLTVKLWDVNASANVATLLRSKESAYFVGFSPDGARLSVSFFDGTVRILDTIPLAERVVRGDRVAATFR
ncbi:MAG TPA: SRPBCC domain-containing protein [Phycisphaerae bacterium]|nr:SRPBCC domain-containing protein [Phycisphaerae bacterium]